MSLSTLSNINPRELGQPNPQREIQIAFITCDSILHNNMYECVCMYVCVNVCIEVRIKFSHEPFSIKLYES